MGNVAQYRYGQEMSGFVMFAMCLFRAGEAWREISQHCTNDFEISDYTLTILLVL